MLEVMRYGGGEVHVWGARVSLTDTGRRPAARHTASMPPPAVQPALRKRHAGTHPAWIGRRDGGWEWVCCKSVVWGHARSCAVRY